MYDGIAAWQWWRRGERVWMSEEDLTVLLQFVAVGIGGWGGAALLVLRVDMLEDRGGLWLWLLLLLEGDNTRSRSPIPAARSRPFSPAILRALALLELRIFEFRIFELFLLRRMMLVHGGNVRKTALFLIGPRRRRRCNSSSGARFNASLAEVALRHRATTVEGTFTGLGDRPIHRIVTDILVV